MMYVTNYVT